MHSPQAGLRRNRSGHLLLANAAALAALSIGCTANLGVEQGRADSPASPEVEQTRQAVNANNGLGLNGLGVNGYLANGLGLNGLGVNGLGVNGLGVNGIGVNGLGINGLGLNGLGINGIGLNGIGVNGLGLNGIGVNGIGLNGNHINGLGINGLGLNGIGLNGIGLNGLYINGIGLNGIGLNGIGLNGLGVNGLGLNGLGLNGLYVNGLTADTAIKIGNANGAWVDLSDAQITELDKVMRHIVGCALNSDDSLIITYPDSGPVTGAQTYAGGYGLASSWKTSAPTAIQQEDVRKCLLAQTQYQNNQIGMGLNSQQEAAMKTLLTYLVSCAIPAGQSVTIKNSAGVDEVYAGSIGLAPEWRTGPLSSDGGKRVTACLAARTNAKAQTVQISLRGKAIMPDGTDMAVTPTETSTYSHHEGAFWGDVFSTTPNLHVCSAKGAGISGRVCTNREEWCGFEYEGDCQTDCTTSDAIQGHSNCSGESLVLNTFLNLVHQADKGSDHNLGQDDTGKVWLMGKGAYGQLGINSTKDKVIAVTPIWPSGVDGTSVSGLAGGDEHTCATMNNGDLYCWGKNEFGQVGVTSGETICGSTNPCFKTPVKVGITDVVQVSAFFRTCALKTNGTVWCWGKNDEGEVNGIEGDGETCMDGLVAHACIKTPTQVMESYTTGSPQPLGGVARLIANGDFACAIKNDGTVWCWGDRSKLGRGTETTSSPKPVFLSGNSGALLSDVTDVCNGDSHACVRKSDGTVWCWGRNVYGQMGQGAAGSTPYLNPVRVTASDTPGVGTNIAPRGLSCGTNHTCATTLSGVVYCWGRNDHLQTGQSGTLPVVTPAKVTAPDILNRDIVSTSAGEGYTCAKASDNTSWCWGQNKYGQFANGASTTLDTTTPSRITQIP